MRTKKNKIFLLLFIFPVLCCVLLSNAYALDVKRDALGNGLTLLIVERHNLPMVMVTLGVLVLAFLMAFIYPYGYQGGAPVKEGMRFGAIMGLLWILPWSLVIVGIWAELDSDTYLRTVGSTFTLAASDV